MHSHVALQFVRNMTVWSTLEIYEYSNKNDKKKLIGLSRFRPSVCLFGSHSSRLISLQC